MFYFAGITNLCEQSLLLVMTIKHLKNLIQESWLYYKSLHQELLFEA